MTTRNNKIRVISARDQRKKMKETFMKTKRKPIPQFKSEDEEREFWATHDSTEYIDWSKAERNPTLTRLKPSTRTISIRLPESLIAELKALANKRDVPYQSLVKIFLSEKVKEETTPYLHPDQE
jgi:predicted DNA binding CopG/RHH family protein